MEQRQPAMRNAVRRSRTEGVTLVGYQDRCTLGMEGHFQRPAAGGEFADGGGVQGQVRTEERLVLATAGWVAHDHDADRLVRQRRVPAGAADEHLGENRATVDRCVSPMRRRSAGNKHGGRDARAPRVSTAGGTPALPGWRRQEDASWERGRPARPPAAATTAVAARLPPAGDRVCRPPRRRSPTRQRRRRPHDALAATRAAGN
jgi:hypothetical protein